MSAWLLVIGDSQALGWVLSERRMAFQHHRRHQALRVEQGDALLLYTTRGCFHNPGRDRGLVIAEAQASSPVTQLVAPIKISGRRFELGCDIALDALAHRGAGVIVADIVQQLEAFPDPKSWSARMRRPLVALSPHDHELIRARLVPHLAPADESVGEYLRLAQRHGA